MNPYYIAREIIRLDEANIDSPKYREYAPILAKALLEYIPKVIRCSYCLFNTVEMSSAEIDLRDSRGEWHHYYRMCDSCVESVRGIWRKCKCTIITQ